MSTRLTFRRCRPGALCPICGRDKDCTTSAEGPVKCMWARSKGGGVPADAPAGFKRSKATRDGGWLYVPVDAVGNAVRADPKVSEAAEAKQEQYRRKAIERARRLWQRAAWLAMPTGGPGHPRLAEYLEHRGIGVEAIGGLPRDLVFDPACYERSEQYADGQGRERWQHHHWPAMVGAVREYSGEVVGVHRTYLAKDGPGKRPGEFGSAKQMLGGCRGRAVRLSPPAGVWIITEGIETGLACFAAVRTRTRDVCVWAAMGDTLMRQLAVPASMVGHGRDGMMLGPVHTIIIGADFNLRKRKHGDGYRALVGEPGTGETSARILANRIRTSCPWVTVVVRVPSSDVVPELLKRVEEGDKAGDVCVREGEDSCDWLDAVNAAGLDRIGAALVDGLDFGANAARKADWSLTTEPPDPPTETPSDSRGVGSDSGGAGGENATPWAASEDDLPVIEPGALERARRYLWERCRVAGEPRFALARWGGEWWRWVGGRYVRRDEELVRGEVWEWLNGFRHYRRPGDCEAGKSPVPLNPGRKTVEEVMGALAVDTGIYYVDQMPRWLPETIRGGAAAWGRTGADADAALRVDLAESDRSARAMRQRIVFQNGVLDLADVVENRRVVLAPHTTQLFTAAALPYELDAARLERLLRGADAGDVLSELCPRWMAWLADASDQDGLWEEQLQQMMGDTLTPDRTIEKIFMVVGPPRSGKGIIQEAISALCGESNVVSTTLSAFAGDRFALAPLVGKIACLFPDAHLTNFAEGAGALDALKSISGQDRVAVRDMHRVGTTVRLSTRLWMFTNIEPDIRDESSAFAARLVMLPLRRSALGAEDPEIKASVPREAPGIMLWALCGAVKLAAMRYRDIAMCGASQRVADEYRRMSSHVQTFVSEWLTVGADQTTGCDVIYEAYQACCADLDRRPLGKPKFFAVLRRLVPGYESRQVRQGNARTYMAEGCAVRVDRRGDVDAWKERRGLAVRYGQDDDGPLFPT